MAKLFNLARMTVTGTPGTGTITLNAAVSGYLTFAQAGVVNADLVEYAIKDGVNSEIGIGTYTSSGTTLARTTITNSTNGNAAISVTSAAEVAITPRKEAVVPYDGANESVASANGSSVFLQKNRAGSIVQSGDEIGNVAFKGWNGTSYDIGAYVRAFVDGTPGASGDMPVRLSFWTTPDGSATPVERMRISQAGNVGINTTPLSPGSGVNTTFTVNQNSKLDISGPPTSAGFWLTGADGAGSGAWIDSYAVTGGWLMRRANTTAAAPSALASGDAIGHLGALGYHSGGAYTASSTGKVEFVITENWTSSAQGSKVVIEATAATTTSRSKVMEFSPAAATAVNYLQAQSTATGVSPQIAFLGADSNLDALLVAKGTGVVKCLGSWTNGSATTSNACIDSAGRIFRNSSQAKYKTALEDIEIVRSKNIVNQLAPKFYRSNMPYDQLRHPTWSYYGLIAEDVAAIDPRLANWDYEFTDTFDQDRQPIIGTVLKPTGVNYDKLFLHGLVAFRDRLGTLEAAVGISPVLPAVITSPVAYVEFTLPSDWKQVSMYYENIIGNGAATGLTLQGWNGTAWVNMGAPFNMGSTFKACGFMRAFRLADFFRANEAQGSTRALTGGAITWGAINIFNSVGFMTKLRCVPAAGLISSGVITVKGE